MLYNKNKKAGGFRHSLIKTIVKNFFKKFIDKDLLSVKNGTQTLSIIALALPIFLENISVHLIGLIQTSMSSHFMDGFFVYAFAIPNTVFGPVATLTTLVTTGMGILLSIYLGKGKHRDCADIIGTSYILNIIVNAIVYGTCIIIANPLLNAMGLRGEKYAEYVSYAITYFKLRCAYLIFMSACSTIFMSSLRCYGHTKYALVNSLISSVMTVILTFIAYYVIKIPKDSVPYVIIGIGVVVSLVTLAYALAMFKKRGLKMKFTFNKRWALAILKVGMPAVVAGLSYSISQTITSTICAYLDPDVLIAKSYINQLVYFVYQLGWSVGQANSLMVGRICGMGDMDRVSRMHRQNIRIVLLSNVTFSLLFAILAKPLFVILFNANGDVLRYAETILWIDILVELGRGLNHVGQYGLNATGDVNYTTVVSMTSCWICSVGLSAFSVYVLGWSLYGMWAAFAIDELFRGFLYYVRWRKNKWRIRFLKEEAILDKATAE